VKDEDILAEYEQELDPPTLLEFNLGMCLGTLLDILDHPDDWEPDSLDNMLNTATEWIETFVEKYGDIMEEYSKRAAEGLDPTPPDVLD
jgi:hypothetical protein